MFKTSLLIFGLSCSVLQAAPKTPVKTIVKYQDALKEESFNLQGEYASVSDATKLQVVALGKGQYRVLSYGNGLPGENSDLGVIKITEHEAQDLRAKLAGYKKVKRTSPTMGRKAPKGTAVVLNKSENRGIKGKVENGIMSAGSVTSEKVGSFEMHLEFKLPYKPDRLPSNQDRGNSGVYIFNRYEIQVLDTFGLDLNEANNPGELQSEKERWCGSLYKFKSTDVNMAFPPLEWQTYDIEFDAPEFGEDGKKVKNARLTVRHNGVYIHKDVELLKGTGAGGKRPEVAREAIYFQNHGNPVEYRNLWIVEK